MAQIIDFLQQETGLKCNFQLSEQWSERQQAFDDGRIDVCWFCGAPYVQKVDSGMPIELLAAPVPAGARYNDQAIYFSDVIVPAETRFNTFEDLRGARWGFNEIHSHSGWHVVRYTLAQRKLGADFFGERIATGGHAESLRLVADGQLDGAAIDSTVLEGLIARNPQLDQRIRIIDTLGPSARPPWVIRKSVPVQERALLRKALCMLHESAGGRALLQTAGLTRFALVSDHDYDGIRQMLRLANAREIWT